MLSIECQFVRTERPPYEQMAIIKQRIDPHTPNLVQFAVARLMRSGAFDAHLRTIRAEHASRCTHMIAAIQRHLPAGSIRFARPTGGLYLWCRLAQGLSATALHERAIAAGVTFVPGTAFYPDPAGDSDLRLCFTSVLPAVMEQGMTRLAACVQDLIAPGAKRSTTERAG
ncbi:MAG: hypothetical protein ACRD1V_10745 [Vicinamibacterales bacterium]